jgi:hypothetical protein
MLAFAIAVGSAIAVLSSLTDQVLVHYNVPGATGMVKWNVAAGLLSVLLTWKLLRWSRERNELLRERERVAMQLNHEVRNAIQVISLNDFHKSGAATTDIKLSVARIERALDEYMPTTRPVRYLHKQRLFA